MSKEIIINKMYVGAYLKEGNNIGHEIINLFKADNGENYIYLNPLGTIEETHEKKDLTVILTRRFSQNVYKVLAKAEGVRILPFAIKTVPTSERCRGRQQLNLTYGGVSLEVLYDKNIYRDKSDNEQNPCVTFNVDRIIKPKNQLLITDNKLLSQIPSAYYIRTANGFGKSPLREYYDENSRPESFYDLMKIIENPRLWEEDNTTEKVADIKQTCINSHYNFLKLIKQEDHELAFSNLFAHFFYINKDAFILFAKEVLGVSINGEYCIKREEANIDILVSDLKNVIVIENKIKSGINGSGDRHNLYGDTVQSQLQKYYDYVNDAYKGKQVHCYIFSPNYNRIDKSRFSCEDKYSIVNYSQIYDFFDSKRNLFCNEPYFEDFVHALYKHTKEYDDELENEMKSRFLNAINEFKHI